MTNKAKMYFAAKDSVPIGYQVNCIAHAAVLAHDTWQHKENYKEWFANSFRKVTCQVNDKEFRKLKKIDHPYLIIGESDINEDEVVLVFYPVEKEDAPDIFKHLHLFGKKKT